MLFQCELPVLKNECSVLLCKLVRQIRSSRQHYLPFQVIRSAHAPYHPNIGCFVPREESRGQRDEPSLHFGPLTRDLLNQQFVAATLHFTDSANLKVQARIVWSAKIVQTAVRGCPEGNYPHNVCFPPREEVTFVVCLLLLLLLFVVVVCCCYGPTVIRFHLW